MTDQTLALAWQLIRQFNDKIQPVIQKLGTCCWEGAQRSLGHRLSLYSSDAEPQPEIFFSQILCVAKQTQRTGHFVQSRLVKYRKGK